ncbi:MAG: hypothetical protein V2A78_00725 [bacterium]
MPSVALKGAVHLKTVGPVFTLEPGSDVLRIAPNIATALGLTRESSLYAILLEAEKKAVEEPPLSIIASPFPTSSWGNLVRVSLTLHSGRGRVSKLLSIFNKLYLYCRDLQMVDGIDLNTKSLLAIGEIGKYLWGGSEKQSTSIFPGVTAILEVPIQLDNRSIILEGTEELHKSLRNVIKHGHMYSAKAAQILQRLIDKEECEASDDRTDIRVEWVSSMLTLNRLEGSWGPHSYKEGKLPNSNIKNTSLRSMRQRLRVMANHADEDHLNIHVPAWKEFIWPPPQQLPPVRTQFQTALPAAVVSYADSDEKYICWHIVPIDDSIVAQFEMVVPVWLEHLWWEWIFTQLFKAQGNLLATYTTSRCYKNWSGLNVIATFPFPRDRIETAKASLNNAKEILDCFRNLTGCPEPVNIDTATSRAPMEFAEFVNKLVAESKKVPRELLDEYHASEVKCDDVRVGSLLRNVLFWHADLGREQRRKYQNHFPANPYAFTKPLSLQSYTNLYGRIHVEEQLYGDNPELGSRGNLARRVLKRLIGDEGENIALVGAHRSGKTSVANLIIDRIHEMAAKNNEPLLAIAINGALTPPRDLVRAIYSELLELVRKPSFVKMSSILLDAFRKVFSMQVTKIKLGLAVVEMEASPSPDSLSSEDAIDASLTNWYNSTPIGEQAQHLRTSVEVLLTIIEEVKKVHSMEYRIVIVLDEMADFAAWGGEQAFAMWRYIIESPDYRSIRWLVVTQRPMGDTSHYSPITNVLREYNIGPLDSREAMLMVDAMTEERISQNNSTDVQRDDLRLVVTYQAKLFICWITGRLPYLMQVACCHIYDRCIRDFLPIMTVANCKKIVESHVIPELSDYFESRFGELPNAAREFIAKESPGNVNDVYADFDESLRTSHDREVPRRKEFESTYQRVLARSGLTGENDRLPVAPLVALWMLGKDQPKVSAPPS